MSDALARPAATHAPARTGRLLPRTAAVAEVLLAFALVHAAFRSFKYFTRLGQAEVAAGLNFSPGTVMILFTVTVLWLRRADFRAYGLTLDGWRSGLSIGLLWA